MVKKAHLFFFAAMLVIIAVLVFILIDQREIEPTRPDTELGTFSSTSVSANSDENTVEGRDLVESESGNSESLVETELVPSGTFLSYPDYASNEYLLAFQKSQSIYDTSYNVIRSRLMQLDFDLVEEFLSHAQDGYPHLNYELSLFEDIQCTIIGTKTARERADGSAWTIVPLCKEGRYVQIGIDTEARGMSVRIDVGNLRYVLMTLENGYVASFERDRSQ